jgi:hypothetical protein
MRVPVRPPAHRAPVVSIQVPPTESIHIPPWSFSATSPVDVVVVVRVVVVTAGCWLAHAIAATAAPIANKRVVRCCMRPSVECDRHHGDEAGNETARNA